MKGAAPLPLKIISKPKNKKVSNIGNSHHFLFCFKKPQYSVKIFSLFLLEMFSNSLFFIILNIVLNNQMDCKVFHFSSTYYKFPFYLNEGDRVHELLESNLSEQSIKQISKATKSVKQSNRSEKLQ